MGSRWLGPRSTPVVDGDTTFALGLEGELYARTGESLIAIGRR